jgi:3-oxoacyl-[acyl-carrier protein] reductase
MGATVSSGHLTGSPVGALANRTLLVTGGSSGIGRAIALAAAHEGADVALTYHTNLEGARETERAIAVAGRRCAVLPFDAAREQSLHGLGPAAREALGRIDVWVNSAGADILTGPAASLPVAQKLDLLLAVDLRGTMLASWQAAEILGVQDTGGVIINMSWDHVLTGMAGINPQMFAAVKGGVLAFSKSLARSVAPRVRVNVVAPGWIETSFGAGLDDATHRNVAGSTPLKRWGTPDDVAAAVVFLASPAASFITGHTLVVGGGIVM